MDAWFNGSIFDHNFKGVFYLSLPNLKKYLKWSKNKLMERIMEHKVSGSTKKLVFPRHHRFFDAFNRKIDQLVTAGIVEHLAKSFEHEIIPKSLFKIKRENYQAMSLAHLEAGFVVWLVSLLFPTTAFIIEWIMTLKEFIVFKCCYKLYMKIVLKNIRKRDRKMQKILRKLRKAKVNSAENCMLQIETENNDTKTTEIDFRDEVVTDTIKIVKKVDTIQSIYEEIMQDD